MTPEGALAAQPRCDPALPVLWLGKMRRSWRRSARRTKVHDRLLRPLLATDTPLAPPDLRLALKTIDQHVCDYTATARLATARNSRQVGEC